jgi:DNA-binding transcriptional LysR family regulator
MNRASELNIQQLQTFQQVMAQGGYAAAARRLELSVPTVWQQMQALERIYNTELFEKHGRTIRPTAAAQRLYYDIASVLAGLDSTFEKVEPDHAKRPIRLVAGVRMLLEDLAVPLQRFRRQYGNRLSILHGNNRVAEELLLADQADLALTLEPGYEMQSPMLHYEPAYIVDFLAICSKQHPFAKTPRCTLAALADQELIVTARGTHGRDALDQAFHREHLVANIAIETDNSGFTIACAGAGSGVGILAGRSSGKLVRSLSVRSLGKQLGSRQIVFMWKRGKLQSEAVQGLIGKIRRYHALP